MAKEASFLVGGKSVFAELTKVDRDKVYGWVQERFLDCQGSLLTWATLLLDGKTLVGTGGTALKTLGPDGAEVSKSTLLVIAGEFKGSCIGVAVLFAS